MFPPKLTPKTKRIVDGLWVPALASFLPLLWAAGHPERRSTGIAMVLAIMSAAFFIVLTVANAERRKVDRASILSGMRGATYNAIVAFDFDGTITTRCSTMAFLSWRAGPERFARGLAKLVPAFAAYLLNRDRAKLKTALFIEFLAGVPRPQLEREAQRFARSRAMSLLRPDALAEIDMWRDAGAQVVIVTASPTILVQAFADLMKIPLVLGTELATDNHDRLTGQLLGRNCRGAEKVGRLHQHFGRNCRVFAAYGDSDGDAELLDYAEHVRFRAFRARP